jgi:ubiquinone/menaquinone biosynthesis C-methylase UbiE
MANTSRRPAARLAKLIGPGSWKVLDLAASHGLFGIAIATQNPDARIVALDWPAVLPAAFENARKAGVADRLTLLAGDALAVDFGSGYDVVLIANFLQILGPGEIATVLRKTHAALKPGGRAVMLGFVPNQDRVTPPELAAFSLMMLGGTRAGDAYPFSECRRMFAEAGFVSSELHEIPPVPQRVIVSLKDAR